MNISKILDLAIIGVVLIFFVGVFAFEYKMLGFSEAQLHIPAELNPYFDFLIWPLVALLIADLVVKYRRVDNPKKFVKKYWIDIVMFALIPVFSLFKIFKVGLGVIKKIKAVKMGTKAVHKTKKVTKK